MAKERTVLNIPPHIQNNPAGKFKWDKEDPWKCERENPRLDNQIAPLYSRAVLAVTLGIAEWVILPGKDNELFIEFLEAVWASIVDRRYLRHISHDEEIVERVRGHFGLPEGLPKSDDLWEYKDLQNPVSGPRFVAMRILGEAADRTTPEDNGSMETVYLSNLAEQVTDKSKAFQDWRRGVIKRLHEHHLMPPDKEAEWLGPVIPREALDLTMPYAPGAQARKAVKQFIENLEPARNRFLMPPADLVKLGMKKPYQFD